MYDLAEQYCKKKLNQRTYFRWSKTISLPSRHSYFSKSLFFKIMIFSSVPFFSSLKQPGSLSRFRSELPHNVPHNQKKNLIQETHVTRIAGNDLTCIFIGCVGDSVGDGNRYFNRYGAGDGLRTRDPQLGRLML